MRYAMRPLLGNRHKQGRKGGKERASGAEREGGRAGGRAPMTGGVTTAVYAAARARWGWRRRRGVRAEQEERRQAVPA